GSHPAHHVMFSFEQLFPRLLPGGWYVVEDAYMHFGWEEKLHSGFSDVALKDYFINLASAQTARFIANEQNYGIKKYLFENIVSISFMKGIIVVQKKPAQPDPVRIIAAAEALAEGGRPEQAEAMARKALALDDAD